MKNVTREMWTKEFKDIADIGDSVDEDIVMEFLNCVPPASNSARLIQMGEAYSHAEDENGRWLATYMTFAKEDDKWIYKGNCFRGQTVNQDRA